MYQELHIFEEETNLFWGLIILVCTAAGTFTLAGSFITMNWNLLSFNQLFALALFLISFWGIFKLSEPLYHFVFSFEDNVLIIKIKKGELNVDKLRIPVQDIDALKFSPHYPRSSNEALFDFSMNYHLMWRKQNESVYRKLIGLKSANFTLKVNDIAKIMHFIRRQNPNIFIPEEQSDYFNL